MQVGARVQTKRTTHRSIRMEDGNNVAIMDLTADIVSAFVSKNAIPRTELPGVIATVHAALTKLAGGRREEPAATPRAPAVPVKKSISEDYLVCLEDGRKFKSLKRHLRSQYNMTPNEYRERWGLGAEYPMVAPGYAKARSAIAKDMGLGQKRRKWPAETPSGAGGAPTGSGSQRAAAAA